MIDFKINANKEIERLLKSIVMLKFEFVKKLERLIITDLILVYRWERGVFESNGIVKARADK